MTTRHDPIRLVASDPSWPQAYARERARVETALRPWLAAPVEHIGSTAVPGLPAKPIIDMLALVHDYSTSAGATDALADIGWVAAPEPGDATRRRRSYCFPDVAYRTHHLHVWEHASPDWPQLLAFRDHLRANPADAAEYARIKAALAAIGDRDRAAYRAGKAPFISALLARIET